eukprot:CAMPEP_0170604166 /NCGR_PEP_ID=MMETSP0224-20130122/19281_1 /TAXON_ID=285029 /ORGANISM="Togula jolla, Strain CCCM 725" /LENGTH=73 /DNA_ID=CAMNT_0010929057 /DNA_START=648 /DNA_END=869 /DNA_ORIENTATION=-
MAVESSCCPRSGEEHDGDPAGRLAEEAATGSGESMALASTAALAARRYATALSNDWLTGSSCGRSWAAASASA